MSGLNPIQVIAVTGGKGGVGKSNMSVNLAVALAELGKRVVLLDADLGLANIDILLGISAGRNISDVLNGNAELRDILVPGPGGVKIIPASSGTQKMANLGEREHAGIIAAFSELGDQMDVLIVDTAAGISKTVTNFVRAAQEAIIVVTDEPTSVTDAYALIKVLNRDCQVDRFRVVANMVRTTSEGQNLFNKLSKVTDRFLDVTLQYVGSVPMDESVRKAVQRQKAVIEAYPRSKAAVAYRSIAQKVATWPLPSTPRGNLEFLLSDSSTERESPEMSVQQYTMYQTEKKVDYNQLVDDHAVLVKRIAHHLLARLPDSVQLDDLVQSGMIGLFEAAQNYDNAKGASFETYAGIRIRGAMLDEVRKGDWIPRSVHRNSRRIADAIREIEMREGRDAQDQEVATSLGMSLDDYYGLLKDTHGSRLFSFEELMEQGNGDLQDYQANHSQTPLPAMDVEHDQLNQHLAEAIKQLPEREQLVLSLYYDEELNLKEIGAVLGVSESRVSQIHSQAALRLRSKLRDWQADTSYI